MGLARRTAIAAASSGCLASALLLPDPVHALDPAKRFTQYAHTSWRTQDGSAPASMYAIAQTADGFLWFLSSRGEIYRFDGVEFRPWPRPAEAGSIGRIRNLVSDGAGGLWLLGAQGIAHWKRDGPTRVVALDGLMPNPLNVTVEPDGSIWVVRGDNSVSEPLCHVKDDGAKCFGKADGLAVTPLDAILADGSGGIWLGGQTALVHWREGVSETYPIEGVDANGAPGILSLARGPDGSIWIGMYASGPGRGLAKLEGGVVRSFVTPTFDGSKILVFSLRSDRHGNLWVGTDSDGILRVRGSVVEHYGRTEGLSGTFVRAFFEDREGILWAATNSGMDKFHDPAIASFTSAEGLSSDQAVGLLAGRDGSVWVANVGSLDRIVAGSVSCMRRPGQQVSSLLEDRAGNLWVAVNDGLYLFEGGEFRPLTELNRRKLGLVFGLIEDNAGNIWAHCFCGGEPKLLRIRNFKIEEEFSTDRIPSGRLAADPTGGIWIGTRAGDLARFHDGKLERFPTGPHDNPFPHHIVVKADGSVLAAFDDGLVVLRHGKAQRMTEKNGLPCGGIFSLVEDREHRWWLNTSCGVVTFPESELERWWADPEAVIQVRLYDVRDGARPSSRPPFHPAACSPDGRVWFVNSGVVQMIDPTRLSDQALPVETYVESIVVDRKEIQAGPHLELSPHPRDVQIHYTSPSFLSPQEIRFRYRLDPYDRDWREAGTRRQAFYNDLAPRKYSFRVMACNSDGLWNPSATTFDFAVMPAFYQTNVFRALCVALSLSLLWGAYQWRVRRLRGESRKLRDVVETIPAIVFEAGADGSGAFANRRWLEYTGASRLPDGRFAPDDPAWRDSTCIHPDDLYEYVRLWQGAIATGQPFELETRVRRADGAYRWFLARHVPLRDKRGRILKWFGTLTDIEDRKQAEQERERLRELEADLAHINRVSMMGELSASIAHEVNQPLSGVVSNGGACLRWLAGDEPNLEEAREAARRIVRDGKRAGDVIARIRALTRRAEVPREPLDINEIIRQVLALLGDQAKRAGVVIRTQLADDVSPVLGDQVQLQQVVLNLTMNAIEAMNGVVGRPRELVIATRNIPPDQVQVTVDDSGTGLDPGTMEKIFDAFYTTKTGGMGMGLSICRSILQAHGGRLWAAAKDGPGTILHFTLPRYDDGNARARVTGD